MMPSKSHRVVGDSPHKCDGYLLGTHSLWFTLGYFVPAKFVLEIPKRGQDLSRRVMKRENDDRRRGRVFQFHFKISRHFRSF